MYTKIHSATTIGIETYPVDVEVDLSMGLLQFFIVGLPDIAIKESKQRIHTALKNSGLKLPERKITVNLAPADLKKEGTSFDLPIALGILQAAQIVQVDPEFLKETIFLGELSLDGSVKPIKGVLPISYDTKKLQKKRIILAQENIHEAGLIDNLEVIGVSNLIELVQYLKKEKNIESAKTDYKKFFNINTEQLDFDQVKGQYAAKRALQIAAAGRHNIIFVGSPGSGKTMLAKRLPTIMPEMSFDEIIETSKIYSVSGKLGNLPLVTERPFRSPHHTISQVGLVGGGSFPQPGEISLSHNGILFLDELTEFRRNTLESLRQPLEHNSVSIARAQYTINFPANFVLVGALNPCPCGFLADKKRKCICSEPQVLKYLAKLSGPLLDRIDLRVTISSLDYKTLSESKKSEISSKDLLVKIEKAIKTQRARFGNSLTYNGNMTATMIEQFCILDLDAKNLIKDSFDKLNITMRGYHKLLKVSRTIADLECSELITSSHIKEALIYRSLEKIVDTRPAHGELVEPFERLA